MATALLTSATLAAGFRHRIVTPLWCVYKWYITVDTAVLKSATLTGIVPRQADEDGVGVGLVDHSLELLLALP